MVKKLTCVVLLIFISSFAIHLKAQEKDSNSTLNRVTNTVPKQKADSLSDQNPDSVVNRDYRILSINITGSWYHPELDFFNEVFLPYFQVSDRFGGNYSFGGNITFTLPKEFRGRFGVSYWKDKVSGSETSKLTSLEIALTRYKLGLLYVPPKLSYRSFQPYIGIDGQFLMVRNSLVLEPNYPIQKGSDYVFAPLVGIEFVKKHFVSSLEYSYNFGNYRQDICDCIGLTRQNVSINGPEISFSIGYKFDERFRFK